MTHKQIIKAALEMAALVAETSSPAVTDRSEP